MPPPINPPPSNEPGAISNPRMLNRWLDINPVFPLKRTETFWLLPAFNVNSNWLGYSDIVAAFNYVAPNNFTINDFVVPTNPNYVACVMWVDSHHVVHRYKLWEDVGEVFFFTIPVYTGQLIKKNYRIEIWSALPAGPILSLQVNAAGTASTNTTYTYLDADNYTNGAKLISRVDAFSVWFIAEAPNVYYVIDQTIFPFGIWNNTEFGTVGASPAPFLSAPITASQSTVLIFHTSVKGGYDYMWQNDSALCSPSPIVTNFSWPLVAGTFPLPFIWPAPSVPTLN